MSISNSVNSKASSPFCCQLQDFSLFQDAHTINITIKSKYPKTKDLTI